MLSLAECSGVTAPPPEDLPRRTASPRVLWVTEEVPDANLGGGSIRQFHLLSRLAKRTTVDLLLVGRLGDDGLRASLNQVVELDPPAPGGRLRQWFIGRQAVAPWALPTEIESAKSMVRMLRGAMSHLGRYDVVHVEHELLGELLPDRRDGAWSIDLQNLLSVRTRQQAALSGRRRVRWLLQRDAGHAAGFERRLADGYDLTAVVSKEDAAALGGRSLVVPNGVDLDKFTPSELPAAPRLLFTGSWNWSPNVDAARWLCTDILPLVRAEVPDATVTLVGRSPDHAMHELVRSEGVEGHFDVPSVVPFLQAARVAVVPVRVGSGTRLKALEAMAAGRPLVGTPIGLEGLGLSDGRTAAIADDPGALATHIIRLCRDDQQALHLAGAARALAEEKFGWVSIADAYVDQLLGLTSSR
jgi:glycosyltransferase involved in cell wall biosynthesis